MMFRRKRPHPTLVAYEQAAPGVLAEIGVNWETDSLSEFREALRYAR